MADESKAEAGRRFAADLREIREARSVTLDDLHDGSKIPRGLLKSFEEDGLFDHPMFNRVYLRSFVRTYAEMVDVSPALALAALDEALEGDYQGRLGSEYLGRKKPAVAASLHPKAAEEPPADEPPVGKDRPGFEKEAVTGAEREALDPDEEAPPAPAKAHEAPSPEPAAPAEAKPEASPPAKEPAPPPRPASTRPAEASRPVPERPARQRPVPPEEGVLSSNKGWLYAAGGVVLLAALIWGLLQLLGGEDPQQDLTATPVVDSAETPAPAEPEPAPPPITVSLPLDVRVISDGAPVQGIRLTVDDDVRRPYWIEANEAMDFTVQNRIVIEDTREGLGPPGQLENIELEVDGYRYPTDQRDEQGRIVIDEPIANRVLNANRPQS